jgi:hypothetical protein
MTLKCSSGDPRHRCVRSAPYFTMTLTPSSCFVRTHHTIGVWPSGFGESAGKPASRQRSAASQRDSMRAYASASCVLCPNNCRTTLRRCGSAAETRRRAGDGEANKDIVRLGVRTIANRLTATTVSLVALRTEDMHSLWVVATCCMISVRLVSCPNASIANRFDRRRTGVEHPVTEREERRAALLVREICGPHRHEWIQHHVPCRR